MEACRVITFQVPNNAAVQIYDYKSKKSRVVFGPDLVMLEPNEEFTQMSLSGGKPKKNNMIRILSLLLGPDFCSDIVIVETSDHARLQLTLSYNWHFDIKDKDDQKEASKIFVVPDFTGDMCKGKISSKVKLHSVEISRIFVSLRFYVKSILMILEVQNLPFYHI